MIAPTKTEGAVDIMEVSPDVPAQVAVNDPMVAMIERVVMNPELSMDRVQAMFDLRERQLEKAAEQAFNAAFAAAMAEMPVVPRSGKNKHSGNRYSTLDDLIITSRPVLARHGLSMNWETKVIQGGREVTAIVRHADGHMISTSLTGPNDSGKQMNPLQGGGSTETYLKRYTGFGILGLASGDEKDDDGGGSGGNNEPDHMTTDDYTALRAKVAAQPDTDAVEAYILERTGADALHDLNKKECNDALALIAKREAKAKGAA